MNITGRYLALVAVLSVTAGCTFNVREEVREVTLSQSSAGLTKVVMQSSMLDDNDIDVQGRDDRTVTIQTIARMLVIKNEAENWEGMQLVIGADGVVGYRCPAAYRERVSFGDITMYCDRTLDCDAETISGAIKIQGMAGAVTAGTVSGNCTVESGKGCSIETVSGDITLTIVSDSLVDTTVWKIKSVSGSIAIEFPNDTAVMKSKVCSVTIKATSGNVTVTVPKGFAANLSYKTTSGLKRVSADFLDADSSNTTISCNTTSGNLRIRTFDQ